MEANKDKVVVFDVIGLEVLGLEMHSIRHEPKMCVKLRYPQWQREQLWVNKTMFKCLVSCPPGIQFDGCNDNPDSDDDKGVEDSEGNIAVSERNVQVETDNCTRGLT